MTRTEFAQIAAYLGVGCGKPLDGPALEVYFDLLGDLPCEVGQLAARRVMLEHKWATFPSVAELRQAAVESMRGEAKELTPAEAWDLAWRAVARIDPELDGSAAKHLAPLPPLVREAVQSFGLLDLCFGKEPVGVLRGQFLKTFDQLQARDRRKALLPPATLAALDDIRGRSAIAGHAGAIVGRLAEAFPTPEV